MVCRQLGLRGGVARVKAAHGQGTGPIVLDNLACTGNELSLSQCQHAGWGTHDCKHSEDASAICYKGNFLISIPIVTAVYLLLTLLVYNLFKIK